MITIGVLSDTHLLELDDRFREKIKRCFADTDMILHAGDLTSLSILEPFDGKEVHAVHGNMCGPKTQATLPATKVIEVGRFTIALIHGYGYMHNTEERLFDLFGPVDCIVYGHTHKPVCNRFGPTLMVNPGSFTATGTFALITIDNNLLKGRILSVESVS